MRFDGLSKKCYYTLMLLMAIKAKLFTKLRDKINYLYREFYISTEIEPVVKEYIVKFYYKDNQLYQFRTKDLKDVSSVIDEIEKSRIEEDNEWIQN